jgi:23S rRNA (cytidine2498-2'-O)-methyltransferase
MGARVYSIDKAPLDEKVAAMPGVDHHIGSGFGLEPKDTGRVDWLFSDMACYPERLLGTVKRWMEADAAENFVCTLKLQGETDHAIVQAFRDIPGSEVIHLSCNKHELTWINLGERRRSAV